MLAYPANRELYYERRTNINFGSIIARAGLIYVLYAMAISVILNIRGPYKDIVDGKCSDDYINDKIF